ncbi:MAG: hypothetical protein IT162_13215 [Bryobacterales bacterium]|nr:hypothetical protein [Bryobacterales bacterium]
MNPALAWSRERRQEGMARMFGASALQAGVGAGAQLLLFGLAARHLAAAEFDRFAAFATIAVWLTISDFGLNKALLAELGRTPASAPRLISTALLLQAAIAAALLLPVWFAAPAEARPAALLALAVAPLSTARAVLAFDQRGWLTAAWDLAGSTVLIGLCLTVGSALTLPSAALLAVAGLAASRLAGALWLAWPAHFDAACARQLWRSGRHFVLAQLADLMLLQGLPWVAVAVLPVGEAGAFSAAAKLAGLLPMALALAAGSALPAYADAQARGDREWARQTLRRSMAAAGALALVASLCLWLAWPLLMSRWLGPGVSPLPPAARLGLIACAALRAAMAPVLAYFYGTGGVRRVAVWTLTAATVGMMAGAWAGQCWGTPGLAISLAAAQLLLLAAPLSVAVRRALRGGA